MFDVEAGFENGRPITLGKILNTTPAEPAPKDAQYTLTNEDGFEVFTGNKQEVQERIETDNQPYTINKGKKVLTDEEFANERNVGMNERTETDPLKNDNVPLQDRIEEDSAPTQNSKDTEEADPDYKFEPQQENVGELKRIGLKGGALKVANIARRTLGLKKPISVIDINELLNADDMGAYFDDPRVAQYVKDVIDELKANPEGGGRYIGFNDAHIVLVDPTSGKNN